MSTQTTTTTTAHSKLTADLAEMRAGFAVRMPEDIRTAMTAADLALAASGILSSAMKAGQFAPDFVLPNIDGKAVRLSDVLRNGPTIVSFYRGGWCPYCNLELRAYQALAEEMNAAGVQMLAISPQKPDESAATVKKNGLGFQVLSDLGSTVSKQFGIAFDLAEELRPIYTRLGHALPDFNGADWVLPIPATYVIGTDRKIILAHVDTDYRSRLEPSDAIAAAACAKLLTA